MKYAMLRGRILERFGSIEKFAKAIGISRTMLSLKLNGHSQFTQQQISDWSKLLDIDLRDIGVFFFT